MPERALKQIPPQALELEESFLSACILGEAGQAVELLQPDEFPLC